MIRVRRYEGTLDGYSASMEAARDGLAWQGRVEVAGSLYALHGSITGDQVQGYVADITTGQQAPLLAQLDETGVTLLMPVQGRLTVVDDASPAPQNPGESDESEGGSSADESGSVDARLVGEWLWTDSSTGAGPLILLQERLILRDDGTFAYGDAKVAGGGEGISVSDSGGEGYQTGRWRADGEWLYVHTGNGFQQYATYTISEASLLLRFIDGSQRLWRRAGS